MRKILCILFILTSVISIAQIQQGFVKTRGRIVDGKLVSGKGLSGAIITLNYGNSFVSDSLGSFSFIIPKSQPYSLVSVVKKGYILVDPDYTKCVFHYSSQNPFYIVLEDVNLYQAELNAATRKVRNTLYTQLAKREQEIEELKVQNKVNEKEYQEQLQILYDNQSKMEQLVKEMAERYVSTDYDLLDDFNQTVQQLIEDGNLMKADSMLHSRGNIEERVAKYHSVVAANKKFREELEQSEKGVARDYEDLSLNLYQRSEIFLQSFLHDSALHYLKMRADLDTTRLNAVWDYAYLCLKQREFSECETYLRICLRAYEHNQDEANIALLHHNYGLLYYIIHDYENCEKYYLSALDKLDKLSCLYPDMYIAPLAMTQNNLGALYNILSDYSNSEKYYKLALKNRIQLCKNDSNLYFSDLAATQNNLGVLYQNLHDYKNSELFCKQSLDNYMFLFEQNPRMYRRDLAKAQNNLGLLYYEHREYGVSEHYFRSALSNYEQLFDKNPGAYRLDLAKTQNNLGLLCSRLFDYVNSEKYLKLALDNLEYLYQIYPETYREELASTQNNLGFLYSELHDQVNSEKYYLLSNSNLSMLFAHDPNTYRNDLAKNEFAIGNLYFNLQDYNHCERYYQLALEHLNTFESSSNFAEVAKIQNNLGFLYYKLSDYSRSEQYLLQANENLERLFSVSQSTYRADFSMTHSILGSLYYVRGDYKKSKKFLLQALENEKILFEQEPNVYRADLATTLNTLGSLCLKLKDYTESEKYYIAAEEAFCYLMNENGDFRVDLTETQNNLGLLYYNTSDYAKSEKYYKSTIENQEYLYYRESKIDDSTLAKSYYAMACVLSKESSYNEALPYLDKAIVLKPKEVEYYCLKGEILLILGKNKDALAIWNKLLSLCPDFLIKYPNKTNLYNGLKAVGLAN